MLLTSVDINQVDAITCSIIYLYFRNFISRIVTHVQFLQCYQRCNSKEMIKRKERGKGVGDLWETGMTHHQARE